MSSPLPVGAGLASLVVPVSGESGRSGEPPACSTAGCGSDASFYLYEPDEGGWRPVCTPHARRRHPSLEVHAWLESGYLKPVELGMPSDPPGDPATARAAAFRAEVEGTMGWDR